MIIHTLGRSAVICVAKLYPAKQRVMFQLGVLDDMVNALTMETHGC